MTNNPWRRKREQEIAVKNFDGFEREFARAASICKIPTGDLYNAMRGDYK